jgi:hypothetical protein
MRVYDLAMTHLLDADDYFIHRVQGHCAEAGLNFFLIEPLWVAGFLENLRAGGVWCRVLLNMHSDHHRPEDVYHRLVALAAQRGVTVIDPPETAIAAFDKARLHPRLIEAGLAVPPSVIVPREEAGRFKLSAEQAATIGAPFVIKPNMGYGRRGVVLDAMSEADLWRSVAAWDNSHYLLQKKIVPRQIEGRPAYFRVYHVFGEVWVCWWNHQTDEYRRLRPGDLDEATLETLRQTVRRIAALTSMSFFSSEIAVDESNQFIVIDYVNDQCHLLTQTANPRIGVPDDVVGEIAARLVAGAKALIHK